ncbi:MAG: restriction endonuclease subunit S [Mycoplasma sp.]
MKKITKLINKLCPDGVPNFKMNEIFTFKTGVDNNYIENGGRKLPWVKLSNTNKYGYINYSDCEIIEHNKNIVEGKNILICWSTDIGRMIWVSDECFFSTAFYWLCAKKDNVNYRFYFHLLNSMKDYLDSLGVGSTLKKANMKILGNIIIPLPPLEIQEKIVEYLDQYTQLNTQLNAQLDAVKQQYEHYRNDIFSKLDSEERGKERLGNVCKIVLGSTPSMANENWWKNGTIPFLDGSLTVSKWVTEKAISDTGKELSKDGDLAFNFFGNFSIKEIASGLITNQQVAILRGGIKLENRFLYHYFKMMLPTLMAISVGTTVKHLNKGIIENIEIIIRSIEKQKEISKYLDDYETLLNKTSGLIPKQIEINNNQLKYYQSKIFGLIS